MELTSIRMWIANEWANIDSIKATHWCISLCCHCTIVSDPLVPPFITLIEYFQYIQYFHSVEQWISFWCSCISYLASRISPECASSMWECRIKILIYDISSIGLHVDSWRRAHFYPMPNRIYPCTLNGRANGNGDVCIWFFLFFYYY